MKNITTLSENIGPRLIMLRNQSVLLDHDMAKIYGVETKRINEVVKNNLDKFPPDYMFVLTDSEFAGLRSLLTISRFGHGGTRYAPRAFTEKGLYMLATLLSSKQAMEATFGIIETYAQVRELQTTLTTMHGQKTPNKGLISIFSELLSDIILPELRPDGSETSIYLNFFIGKVKHTIKRKRCDDGSDIVEEPEEEFEDSETEVTETDISNNIKLYGSR